MVKAATVGTLSITSADSLLIHFQIKAVESSQSTMRCTFVNFVAQDIQKQCKFLTHFFVDVVKFHKDLIYATNSVSRGKNL